MEVTHSWRWRGRSRLLALLAMGTAVFTSGAALPPASAVAPTPLQPLQLADITINVPVIIPGYPVIVVPGDREAQREVLVRFVAQGDDWATVYLNGRLLFRASNTRRDYVVRLDPGAYYLEITGVTRFEKWGSGYLDLGRNDASVVVVRYAKTTGIQVAGDPYAWLPD
ncbi:MAG TPA: hypothetical protein V6D02_09070 [Candidatus Obscuribacterales bacterium]